MLRETLKYLITKEASKADKKKDFLLISNQPYCYYQLARALGILKHNFSQNSIHFDVAEEEEKGVKVIKIYLDSLASFIYELRKDA